MNYTQAATQETEAPHDSPNALSGLCQSFEEPHPIFGGTAIVIVMSIYCVGMAYVVAKYLDMERHNWIFTGYGVSTFSYCIYKVFFCEHFSSIRLNLESKTIDVSFKSLFGSVMNFTYSKDDISGIEWEPSEIRLLLPGVRQAQLPVSKKINPANLNAEKFARVIASALEVPLTMVTFKATGDGG